jgi:hypothetical protein
MNWTMPRPVLNWVAVLLAVACLGSFGLGIATAPSRGHLPGERQNAQAGQPLQAVEATPLGEDRIEGSSAAPELSDEEKARLAEEKEAKEEAAAAKAQADATAAAGANVPPPAVQPAAPAEAAKPAQPAQPKPEEPPF